MIPIADVQWFSLSDYPGVPSAIIFTQGCNLSCKYCHNKQLIPIKCTNKKTYCNPDYVLERLRKIKGKLEGVVITGGEPTVHSDLIWFIKQIKALGFKVKLDTNGTNESNLSWLLYEHLLDYVAIDIKAPWKKYSQITPISFVERRCIKWSLQDLKRSKIQYEIRTTFDKSVLNEEDLGIIKSYVSEGVLHRINECVKPS
jgi:pyruvate formate lyase activating enzyme